VRSSTSPADERKDTYKDEENSAAIEPRRHTSPDHRLPTLLTSPGIFTQHQLDSVLYGMDHMIQHCPVPPVSATVSPSFIIIDFHNATKS